MSIIHILHTHLKSLTLKRTFVAIIAAAFLAPTIFFASRAFASYGGGMGAVYYGGDIEFDGLFAVAQDQTKLTPNSDDIYEISDYAAPLSVHFNLAALGDDSHYYLQKTYRFRDDSGDIIASNGIGFGSTNLVLSREDNPNDRYRDTVNLDVRAKTTEVTYDFYNAVPTEYYYAKGDTLLSTVQLNFAYADYNSDTIPTVKIIAVNQGGSSVAPVENDNSYVYNINSRQDCNVTFKGEHIMDGVTYTLYSGGATPTVFSKTDLEHGAAVTLPANSCQNFLGSSNYQVFGYNNTFYYNDKTARIVVNNDLDNEIPYYNTTIKYRDTDGMISMAYPSYNVNSYDYTPFDYDAYDPATNPLVLAINGSGYTDDFTYSVSVHVRFANTEYVSDSFTATGAELNSGITKEGYFDEIPYMTLASLTDGTFEETGVEVETSIHHLTETSGFTANYHASAQSVFLSQDGYSLGAYERGPGWAGGDLFVTQSGQVVSRNVLGDHIYLYLDALHERSTVDSANYYVYAKANQTAIGDLGDATLVQSGIITKESPVGLIRLGVPSNADQIVYTIVLAQGDRIAGMSHAVLTPSDELDGVLVDETLSEAPINYAALRSQISDLESLPSSFQATLETDDTFEDEFEAYLKVENYVNLANNCGGICGLVGQLTFNHDQIELISVEALSDFEITEGNSIVLNRSTGVSPDTAILKLRFRNKTLADSEPATIKFVEITGSDGVTNIASADAEATITRRIPVRSISASIFTSENREIFSRAGSISENGNGFLSPIDIAMFGAEDQLTAYYNGYGFDDGATYDYVLRYYEDGRPDSAEELASGTVSGQVLNAGAFNLLLTNHAGYGRPSYELTVSSSSNLIFITTNTLIVSDNANIAYALPRYSYSVAHPVDGVHTVPYSDNISVNIQTLHLDDSKNYTISYNYSDYASCAETESAGLVAMTCIDDASAASGAGVAHELTLLGSQLNAGYDIALPSPSDTTAYRNVNFSITDPDLSAPSNAVADGQANFRFIQAESIVPDLGTYQSDFDLTLSRIPTGTTAATIASVVAPSNGYSVQVVDQNGIAITGTSKVGTGAKIQLIDGRGQIAVEYTVKIKGDLSGDGEITVLDLVKAKRDLAGLSRLSGIFAKAGDLIGSGRISITDLVKICRHVAGLEGIRQ